MSEAGDYEDPPEEFDNLLEPDEEVKEEGSDADSDGEEDDAAPAEAAIAASQQPMLRDSNRPRTVHVVADGDRVTDNRLQLTEASQVLSMRAEQISLSGTHMVLPCPELRDAHDSGAIAQLELYQRRCPLLFERQVGETERGERIVERWDPNEMALPAMRSFLDDTKFA